MEKLIIQKLKNYGDDININAIKDQINDMAKIYSQPEIINDFGIDMAADMAAHEIYMDL